MSAEVAQTGRAPDSIEFIEGEAEDRVVAGSSPALGTTTRPATFHFLFLNNLAFCIWQTYSKPASIRAEASSSVLATLRRVQDRISLAFNYALPKL